MKGLVVAGVMSGCGKTTVSLGVMAALAARGLRVAPFKVGPDFIDPGHHARVTGRTSRNLDGWVLSKEYNVENFRRNGRDADIAVVEGVMGLFDGYDGKSEAGSTAQMAKWLDLPVLLVVDARSMARSAAAVVRGFENFDPGLRFAGVVFNKLGSDRHLDYLKEAVEDTVNMPCLGGLHRDADISIPERHLGLVTQEDHPLSADNTRRLADVMERGIDLDRLLASLPETPAGGKTFPAPFKKAGSPVRIGIAEDNAFCFYYKDNLDLLEAAGAELVYFSPVKDSDLPENLHGLYLGGGYPELFAARLSENKTLRARIKEKSDQGMPIYAECGGFMYLCREIRDPDGVRHPMAGCFPFKIRMLQTLKSLGYREVRLEKETIIGEKGERVRGHEFHYSEMEALSERVETVYSVMSRAGQKQSAEGYRTNNTLGGYMHLHFGSHPGVAERFVENCRRHREKG
ncbi:MAG: cobyrinate a,c-diamide synthase [Desulfobacterales bacterium]|nr:cobyrinate a,c-diamide synthase [Desulfobacterales bacterium]